MPLSDAQLSQIRGLLRHHDPEVVAQGRELLVTLAHEHEALRGVDLAGAHLSHINLSGRDLRDINLTAARLRDADLRGADLRGAVLDDADLSEARLQDADLSGASARGANLTRTDLDGATLRFLDLREATLRCALPDDARVIVGRRAEPHLLPADAIRIAPATDQPGLDLSGLTLTGLRLEDCDLRGANLSGGCFRRARLSHSDLTGADLSGATMHRARLRGAWLREADLTGADLTVADLSGADLSGADLSGADLSGADLSGANLTGAIGADLSGAKTDGLRQGQTAAVPGIDPDRRLAQLRTDPDWTVRRLALLHQARTGDAAAALRGFIAAENAASAAAALVEVVDRYTAAQLQSLPQHFPHRQWILTAASLRTEPDPARIAAVLKERAQQRTGPLQELVDAIPADRWPAVRRCLRLDEEQHWKRKLRGLSPKSAPRTPTPTPSRSDLEARVLGDGSLNERRAALYQRMRCRLVDEDTRALLLRLLRDPTPELSTAASHWLAELHPDDALIEALSQTIARTDRTGSAAIRALVAVAVRHPGRAPAVLDRLIALLDLPGSDARLVAARHGGQVLLEDSTRPDRPALLLRFAAKGQRRLHVRHERRRIRTLSAQSLIDARILPEIIEALWQDSSSPRLHALATAPEVALSIARDHLSGPWSMRTRTALRLCEALGPAASPLLPAIRPHLAHPDPAVQRAAAAALGAIGDPAALPWLAATSQAPDRHLRRVAVRSMIALSEPDIG